MKLEKEELILQKRMIDLSKIAERKNINTFTDFLNLAEINLFYSIKNELSTVEYGLFGGYEGAERKVLCFYGDTSVKAFTCYISCIKISPLNKKFSDDLNHRDYLGAILNLGIERCMIGDILVKEKEGYVFCETSISRYIIDNLDKVKHTNVKLSIVSGDELDIKPNFKEIRGTVSSERLDAIIALAFNTSRSSITSLITGGKVYIDGKLVLHNSYNLKINETISVRGHGKFIYKGLENQTKKGRYYVTILKYI